MKVERFDYIDIILMPTKSYSCSSHPNQFMSEDRNSLRQDLTDGIADTVQCRFIVVKDLFTELIDVLGSAFDVSPETFKSTYWILHGKTDYIVIRKLICGTPMKWKRTMSL